MSDLALGIIVFVIAAVPASLLLLALADVIRLEGEGRRRRWIRNCLWALAIPASLPLGSAVWGWAGAAHLEPLCQNFATPDYRTETPVEDAVILLEGDAALRQAWVASLAARLPRRLVTNPADPGASGATHLLEVRRVTHHRNLWFDVQMMRFRLLDRHWGAVIAEADELWVDAGRARYHCGVVSGPVAVSRDRTPWPGGDGVARFVERALRGKAVAVAPAADL